MDGKIIVEVSSPTTQSIESGKALAKFLGFCEEVPEKIPLANGSQLTLSSKKDCYYVTSRDGCSCPAGQYNRICKHRREQQAAKAKNAEPTDDFYARARRNSEAAKESMRASLQGMKPRLAEIAAGGQ
jgi:hypothetical protein